MSDEVKLVRRKFIKNAAVAGAAVAAGGVVGIVPAAVAGAPRKWDKKADVVIIGSAVAGMSAAIEAADAGTKVIVVEKESQPGGLTKFSGGHMTVAGTDVQARLGVHDKPDWLYEDMMENSEMTAVPELVRTYVDHGPEEVLWLQQLGVKFANYFIHSSSVDRRVDRGHQVGESPDYPGGRPSGNGGLGLMLMLFKAADRRGVTTLLNHKMTRIIRADAGGPVIGVEVYNEGKTLNIKAHRGIIVATGGNQANSQMCMAEDPRLTPDIYADGLPYVNCFGEGHLAAVNVGAALSNMAFGGYLPIKWGSRVYQVWEPPTFTTVPSEIAGVNIAFQHVILVKSDGKRYVNEMLGSVMVAPLAYPNVLTRASDFPNHPFNEAYLNLRERPRNVWAVTDMDGAKAMNWQIDQIRKPDPKSGVALYPDMVATADNLKDLAPKMGVDPEGLDATITRYNGFVDAGTDADFGKPKPANRIVQGPFCAVKLGMLRHTRRCGIRVNTRSQVLDRSALLVPNGGSIDQEKTIPHLYAAGECANYLGRYHSHGTLGIYSFYGRVAGKNAALEEQSV